MEIIDTKKKTIIFIDWDDTILPTTVLLQHTTPLFIPKEVDDQLTEYFAGNIELNPNLKPYLHKLFDKYTGKEEKLKHEIFKELLILQDVALSFIYKLKSIGDVYIVTNSVNGWVKYSSEIWMTLLIDQLYNKNIISEIISAFSDNSNINSNPVFWKYNSMKNVLAKKVNLYDHFDIISIGDSNTEREAIHVLAKEYPNCTLKSIKMIEKPTINQLNQQLSKLNYMINSISTQTGYIDYQL